MPVPVDAIEDELEQSDPVTFLEENEGKAYTVAELMDKTGYAQQSLSKKLRKGEDENLVSRERAGGKDFWFATMRL